MSLSSNTSNSSWTALIFLQFSSNDLRQDIKKFLFMRPDSSYSSSWRFVFANRLARAFRIRRNVLIDSAWTIFDFNSRNDLTLIKWTLNWESVNTRYSAAWARVDAERRRCSFPMAAPLVSWLRCWNVDFTWHCIVTGQCTILMARNPARRTMYFRPIAGRRNREETSTGVVNSRYDYSNRHHELIDPLISVKTIGVIQLVYHCDSQNYKLYISNT